MLAAFQLVTNRLTKSVFWTEWEVATMIVFSCPKCRSELEVSGQQSGKTIKCPECGTSLKVPAPKKEAPDKETQIKASSSRAPAPIPAKGPPPKQRSIERKESPTRPPSKKAEAEPKSNSPWMLVGIIGGSLVFLAVAGAVIGMMVFKSTGGSSDSTAQKSPDSVPRSPIPTIPKPPPGAAQKDEEEDSSATAKKTDTTKKEEEDFVEPAAVSGTDVYKHSLKSVALILSVHPGGGVSLGTGTLIDQKNKLVLTNFHVGATGLQNKVYFPIYREKDGSLVVEQKKFLQLANKDQQNIGRVLEYDQSKDLALVQIDFVPKEIQAMPVARGTVSPGQKVYSIGNAGAVGGSLWGYFSGEVRQVVNKTFMTGGPGMPPFQMNARMVEATNPSNPGDSGGPLINEHGELVGVTQGYMQGRQQMSHFIAASEATQFIENHFKKLGQQWARATPTFGGATVDVAGLVKRLDSRDNRIRTKAIVTLGKIGPPARLAVPALLSTMKDSDDLVRKETAAALKKIGPPEKSEKPLLEKSLSDGSPEVRAYAAEAIGKLGLDARQEVGSLANLIKTDKDASVRHSAAVALGMMGAFAKDQVSPVLVKALDDSDKDVRLAAGEALSNMEPAASDIPSLVKALKQQDMELRVFAARALGNLGPQARSVVPDLIEASKNGDSQARGAAITAMGQVGSEAKTAVPSIVEAMKQKDTRDLAIVALGKIGPDAKAAVPDLAKNLSEKECQSLVIEALGKIGPDAKAAVPELADLLKNSDKEMRPLILAGLTRIGAAAKAAIPAIGDCLDPNEKEISLQALTLLATFGTDAKEAVGQIIPLFAEDEEETGKEENKLRAQAIKTLGKIGKPAVQKLQTALKQNPSRRVKVGIIDALGEIGPDAKPAAPYLEQLSRGSDSQVSRAAFKALTKILR
jgi:HEAT repeat protein/S1-C subfamily serine protease